MAKLNLPTLSDLNDDPDTRYGELEEHIRRLERRMERRASHIDDSVTLLRDAEEALLKEEKIHYEYFGHDEVPRPKQTPDYVVETLAGIVFLYGIDEAGFDLVSLQVKERLGDENDRITKKIGELHEVVYRYSTFMEDFAVRYATVIVVGEEDLEKGLAAAYCLPKTGKVMFAQADAHQGYSEPAHEEEGTIEDYLGEQKQQELAMAHAACDHNTYIITHPSDIFDQETLAFAAGLILQERYFKARPDAKKEFEAKEHIANAQGLGAIFSVVNEATKDPLGIGSDDDEEKPN